jgi:hypothetical protein
MAQVVESLSVKPKAMTSNPSIIIKTEGGRQREGGREGKRETERKRERERERESQKE